jgi:uncharacterized protein YfaP (DUF2135 family)
MTTVCQLFLTMLSWNEHPSELSNSKGEHVCYRNKRQGNMRLDVTSGRGPETIRFTVESGVKYWICVHHFAGEGSLAASGEKIQAYGIPEFAPEKPFQVV